MPLIDTCSRIQSSSENWIISSRLDDEPVPRLLAIDMEPSTEDLRPQVLQNTLQQISSIATGEATECCVICLGDLVERCEAQPCQHNNFDYLCLITCLREQASCPLCKSDVREIRYELSGDGKEGKVYKLPGKSHGQVEEGLSRSPSLSERRSSSYSGRPTRALHQYEDEAIQRRRFIYRHNLYSLHVGSNRRQPAESRYRELSPQLFMTDPELLSRARMWLCRELQVFEFLDTNGDPPQDHDPVPRRRPSKAAFLLEYVIAILKTLDIQSSAGQAEDMIQQFLGRENTRLFLHELKAWLRSPYRWLSAWDRAVQYNNQNAMPRESQNVGRESGTTTPMYPDH